MATKPRKSVPLPAAPAPQAPAPDAAAPETSAQNVWLAGLGALASAQAEGSKAYEALIKQGLEMQARTEALAKARMAEAAERMEAMTSQATGGAASWNRLGGIFENRVAQALAGLGMPSAQDIAELRARVEALENALGQGKPAKAPARAAAKKPSP